MALLEVENLDVTYATKQRPPLFAVRNVNFELNAGEFVGLVGESGSGKSTLGNAILKLLLPPGRITAGSVRFEGKELTTLPDEELRQMRWRDFSTVFQSSMNSLNPVTRIEAQFQDVMAEKSDLSNSQIHDRIGELLQMVKIDPSFMRYYPHELSGGMKQRVALALALALKPKLVILDEPTTGLDVLVQKEIMHNLRTLQREQGFAVLLISHDLGTVLEVSDRVLVMYAGEMVEDAPTHGMLKHPIHPYTHGLLGSYADPAAEEVEISYIPGRPPDLTRVPKACPYAPRCPEAIPLCRQAKPQLLPMWDGKAACHVAQMQWNDEQHNHTRHSEEGPKLLDAAFSEATSHKAMKLEGEEVLRVENVSKTYQRRAGFKTTSMNAVNDVSFNLRSGKVTGLVGQSGSGKTTIARMITGTEYPTSGAIWFGETRVDKLKGRGIHNYRKHVQYVFQDPFSALNPVHTIQYLLMRPLMNYGKLNAAQARQKVRELLETVGLTPAEQFETKMAHQLSGGQRQRVVVARALAPDPDIIIADEPISMLDVSIRAEILQLLDKLVRERKIAMLYITHDLLSARLLSDEILVLNQGHVVEQGAAKTVIRQPTNEYTQLLLEAIPRLERPDHVRASYVPTAEPTKVQVDASPVSEE
ncbi:oligopeptide ABC transporter ATP-binding protein OppF [Dictyobacter vulcani]|uniref:Nickel import system ATP-binding protein NikD n=1 Tax=Dictyobacter vulcani TaxID=2607529 RepID=A0A5J4KNY4_9CHLR|nr:ABC transporter ATP-binding protein [Dictyobacter vulcani]GER91084.1 oligopeptide ABC transporter ATP-binding protein OppF [Dictyobacter vulcani]